MMDKDQVDDAQLEKLFEEVRAQPIPASEALMARVLADARAAQPAAPGGIWRGWLAALGGLPGLGGMVTATCVGFWLGVAPPAGLPDLGAEVLGFEIATEDELTAPGLNGFGWDIEEG